MQGRLFATPDFLTLVLSPFQQRRRLEKEVATMPTDYEGCASNSIALSYSELSPSGKLLVSTMRRIQFGRFEGLRICNGEPVWDPPPRLVRVAKIGSGEEPEIAEPEDWVLKAAVRDLFKEFWQVQNGVIDRVVFHRGLPCLVEVAIGSTGMDPAECAGRTEQ
jgi:hypothetical protein